MRGLVFVLGLPFLAPRAPRAPRVQRAAEAPEAPDVRELLGRAGLLPPPTETWVSEDELVDFETPLDQLKKSFEENIIKPNQEALVPEGQEVDFETPLSALRGEWELRDLPPDIQPLEWIKQSLKQEQLVPKGKELEFETPISFLFQEDEELEAEEMWSDLIAPLLSADTAVDTMNESNYLTVTVNKPLGLTVGENRAELGGGVAVLGVEADSNLAGLNVEPGFQLLAAAGMPVHGMSLEDAVRPIEAAEAKVQLTFFKGSAEAFYGLLGPKPGWLSSFLHKLHIQHTAWQWQEGRTPQGRTWSWALELMEELRHRDVDEDTYSSAAIAAMEACQKASRWQPALALLRELRPPSASAFRAAVLSCDRGGQPLRAMQLLDEMLAQGLEPDAATYDSSINSCRAFLRGLQQESSVLPDLMGQDQRRKRRPRSKKLL